MCIPFSPMLMPPAATACQLCAGVPGTQVAVRNCAVGTTQLTSATSVEPPAGVRFHSATFSCDPMGRGRASDCWISSANARSSSV